MFFRQKRQDSKRSSRCYSITIPAGIILIALIFAGAMLLSLMRNFLF